MCILAPDLGARVTVWSLVERVVHTGHVLHVCHTCAALPNSTARDHSCVHVPAGPSTWMQVSQSGVERLVHHDVTGHVLHVCHTWATKHRPQVTLSTGFIAFGRKERNHDGYIRAKHILSSEHSKFNSWVWQSLSKAHTHTHTHTHTPTTTTNKTYTHFSPLSPAPAPSTPSPTNPSPT